MSALREFEMSCVRLHGVWPSYVRWSPFFGICLPDTVQKSLSVGYFFICGTKFSFLQIKCFEPRKNSHFFPGSNFFVLMNAKFTPKVQCKISNDTSGNIKFSHKPSYEHRTKIEANSPSIDSESTILVLIDGRYRKGCCGLLEMPAPGLLFFLFGGEGSNGRND
jgi:hypothetical protein